MTASDDATTINNIKAWTGIQKTFKICENPPANIMINDSPSINNFPLELLINEFEKADKSENIEDISKEFLEFVGKIVPQIDVQNFINNKIKKFKLIYGFVEKENYKFFLESNENFKIEIPDFIDEKYDSKFGEMINFDLADNLRKEMIIILKKIFCHYLISESTGVVISGISLNEYFPSSISFNMILNNNGKIEIMNKKVENNCNRTKFDIYGETDVIDSFFTGIDENFETTLIDIISNIFNPTENQLEIFNQEINLLKTLNKNDLLKNISSLPDEELFEMMEILIKSTNLKRKLLSDIDSVGSNVHIEKITKEKGIETEEKIFKTIKTIKK